MLAKKFRFHGLGALNFVYRKGQTERSGPLALKYILNKRQENFRAAVVVSKKVEKSAVKRNRIRRRVFESFALYKDKVPAAYDLVFSVYDPNLTELKNKELNGHIKSLLEKAKIL